MSYKRFLSLAMAGAASMLAGCTNGAVGSIPSLPQSSAQSSLKPQLNAVNVATNLWLVNGNHLMQFPAGASGNAVPSATYTFSNAQGPSGRVAIRNINGNTFVIYAVGSTSQLLEDEILPGNPNLKNVGGVTWSPALTNATDVVMTDALVPVVLTQGFEGANAAIVAFNSNWQPQTSIPVDTGGYIGHIALDPFSQGVWMYPIAGKPQAMLYNTTSRTVLMTQPTGSPSDLAIATAGIDVNENEQLFAPGRVGSIPGYNLYQNPPNNQYTTLNTASNLWDLVSIVSDKSNVYILGQDANTNYQIDVYPDSGSNGVPLRTLYLKSIAPASVAHNIAITLN